MNADEYSKMFELEDHYWWFVARRSLALNLVERSIVADQPRILDLGCGTGVVSREMERFSDPVSLDFSAQALSFCASRGLKRLVRADATSLPCRDGAFDGVVSLDVFEHIEDDRAAVQEAFRVLRPGGILVLSVPAFRSLWGPHDIALHHFRRYRRDEVRDLLRDAGFQVDRISYSVFFLFPAVVLTRIVEKRRKGPAKASLPAVPEWLNRLLIGLQRAEAALIERGWKLPWGSSVVAVGRKPAVGGKR